MHRGAPSGNRLPDGGRRHLRRQSAFLKPPVFHAQKLGFHLPSNSECVEFTAPLPPDLENALKEVEKGMVE